MCIFTDRLNDETQQRAKNYPNFEVVQQLPKKFENYPDQVINMNYSYFKRSINISSFYWWQKSQALITLLRFVVHIHKYKKIPSFILRVSETEDLFFHLRIWTLSDFYPEIQPPLPSLLPKLWTCSSDLEKLYHFTSTSWTA